MPNRGETVRAVFFFRTGLRSFTRYNPLMVSRPARRARMLELTSERNYAAGLWRNEGGSCINMPGCVRARSKSRILDPAGPET